MMIQFLSGTLLRTCTILVSSRQTMSTSPNLASDDTVTGLESPIIDL